MTREELKAAIVLELNSWDRRFDGAETIAENILKDVDDYASERYSDGAHDALLEADTLD